MFRGRNFIGLLSAEAKAAFTVEASFVMGIGLIIILTVCLLSFNMYHESINYMEENTVSEIDVVRRFKSFQIGKEITEGLFGE